MKINRIQFINNCEYKNFSNNKKQQIQDARHTEPSTMSAYMDFNINFRGRTPEDFYAQEFNIKGMPVTMKKYLDEDSETRKHMPPEQIMRESFIYLDIADNFEDVKSIYLTEDNYEPLFADLHDASPRIRTGIISEIRLARQLSDQPLFKDGSDNFGMYLLKKIYLEGKTAKEINKDFYEKDINPEYLGAITSPIDNSTTPAYGIRYPLGSFWHSFMATRDEYKKFFVRTPSKTKAELREELNQKAKRKSTESAKAPAEPKKVKHERKYKIKGFRKTLLKDDIKKTKDDAQAIEKVVRKRFSKDDPEASFIVKYLSPIMTVAADRVHLSEEERLFAETEKEKGKKVDNLFAQFWKANPELLEQYSSAITDSIEMFEDIYGCGGMVPINNEYQVITPDSENNKAIDYVSEEFAQLLEHVQTIGPKREKLYAEHDRLQKEWDEHFLWRYGEVVEQQKDKVIEQKDFMEVAEEIANKENASIYTFHSKMGEQLVFTMNLDEGVDEYINSLYCGAPSAFIKCLRKKLDENPFLKHEIGKLSFALAKYEDMLEEEQIFGESERNSILNITLSQMETEKTAALFAMLAAYSAIPGVIPARVCNGILSKFEYPMTDSEQNRLGIKAKLNDYYRQFLTSLKPAESVKAVNIFTDYLRNFDLKSAESHESFLYDKHETRETLYSMKQQLKDKSTAKGVRIIISNILTMMGQSRMLLEKNVPVEQFKIRCELIAFSFVKNAKYILSRM